MASASIYKIRDRITGKCYIGCTTLPIDVRIYQHQKGGNNCSSQEVMASNTYEVEVLEKCALEHRFEREAWYINEFRDYVVNRTGLKVVREVRESRLANRKAYTATNIEAETKAEYDRKYKTEARKKEVMEYNQDYYDKNKARLTAKMDCECGGRYCQLTKTTHVRSKKHVIHAMEAQIEQIVVAVVI